METTRKSRPYAILCGLSLLLTAALVYYSQTKFAFAWDEGFHLLTAQLIKNGRRPYLDFFFPQTPLNAYWNAFWMKIFGDTWRTAHIAAALCTSAAVFLTIDFVYTRFRIPRWQFAAGLTAVFLVGLNESLVEFGAVGQAYGLSLFLTVASFRLALIAARQRNPLLAALTGCVAGAAAGSTLLTAPVLPILLIWIAFYTATDNRWTKVAAYLVGAGIPFIPIALLALQNFRVVLFNIIEYHAFHRQEEWDGALKHDLEIYSNWVDSGQALILIALGIAGLWYIRKKAEWGRAQKGEFYLCAWLTVAITLHLMNAHPTFSRYWLFTVPFVGSLASAGLYAIALKLSDTTPRPLWPLIVVGGLVCLGEARSLNGQLENTNWEDTEKQAAKMLEVSPPGAAIVAPEQVMFAMKRTPPPGLEHADSHKLSQTPEFSRQLHVIPNAAFEKLVQEGAYDAVDNCDDAEKRETLQLAKTYTKSFDIGDCRIYWGKAPKK
jgi:hypothetical protein